MNIANEVRELIEATKKCLGPRPCDFRLLSHPENQSLTKEEEQNAQKSNIPILIKKHDGSFSVYGKRPRAVWRERPLKNLTEEQRKALIDLDFAQSILKFEKDLLKHQTLISALQQGHPATIYEQSLTNTFQDLLYEGIPELKEEPFYYPIYEMCATEQNIPAAKKSGYIYLYIKDEKLHYQTQWIVDPGRIEQPPVFEGIIHLEARLLQPVQFVDSPVKEGDPIRTLWYMAAGNNCIYACISDNQQIKVGSISITPKCNLFLCDTLEESAPPQRMAMAQQQKTPILIRRANKFSIYGHADGVWQERALENLSVEEQALLNHLSFEKSILRANEIEEDLIDIVRKGHAEAGDVQQSIRGKLLVTIKEHCRSEEENLKELKEKIGADIAEHMQPFYEDIRSISRWHNEILKLETGFLNSAEELLAILGYGYDLCLMSDLPELGPKNNKIYLDEKGNYKVLGLDYKTVHSDILIGIDLSNLKNRLHDAKLNAKLKEDVLNITAEKGYILKINTIKDDSILLEQEDFSGIFVNDLVAEQLIDKLKENFVHIFLNQKRIVGCLREFKNSSQLIDHLKEAYGTEFNAVLYSEMTLLLTKFDLLLRDNYDWRIKIFFEGNTDVNSPKKLVHFLARKNLTGRFSAQYVLRRPLLFTSFSGFFRKGHLKFTELAPVYSAVNKSAVAANRAQDGGFEDRVRNGEEDPNHYGFTDLILMVGKEKDPYKKMNLELIQPLFAFLILDTQSASEKRRERNDAASFYLQRRILIEQLQKFRRRWKLQEEASIIADNAFNMILSSGYQVSKLELNGDEITYTICLKKDPSTEIRGSIGSKELQGLDVPEKFDLEDASSMANILWVIARKDQIPGPNNDDIVLLLKAIIQVIGVLSPDQCSLPENNEPVRRGRLQPSLEKRPKSSMDSPEPTQNVKRRTLSVLSSKMNLFPDAPFFSSQSFSEIDKTQFVSSPASGEWSLSTSPTEVERTLSTSPLKVDYPSSHSPVEFPADSSSIPQERAHGSFSSSLLEVGDSSPSSSGNQEEINHLRTNLYKASFWKTIDLENMKKLCAYNDFNGFYILAGAAKDGRYGIPEDRVAAYYLSCLAENNIASVKNKDEAKEKIEILRSQIILPSLDAECNVFFREKFGFDPKKMFLDVQAARIEKRLRGPA